MAPPKKSTKKRPAAKSPKRPVRAGKTAPRSEKMQIKVVSALLNRTFLIVTAAVITGLVLVWLIFLWFNRVYADPENVFWGAVDNNLATLGVTKEVNQPEQGGSSTEFTQFSWNPAPRIRNIRQLAYPNNTGQMTNLVLEGIITPTTEYQHYSKIDRPGDGNRDYSDIYKMWLKNTASESPQGNTAFNNAIYGAFLFGNFQRPERAEIVSGLRNALKVDLRQVDKTSENGRRTYVYQANLNLRKYAQTAKLYAKFMNLPSASLINPSNYPPDRQIALKVKIDVLSRQLRSVQYQSSVTELYSGYGIPAQTRPPAKTVSSQQLQKAIEKATK